MELPQWLRLISSESYSGQTELRHRLRGNPLGCIHLLRMYSDSGLETALQFPAHIRVSLFPDNFARGTEVQIQSQRLG